MLRVASLLYSIISATFAGTLVIVALVSGVQTGETILMAAGTGFALAIPVSLLVARRITATS